MGIAKAINEDSKGNQGCIPKRQPRFHVAEAINVTQIES